MQVEDSDVITPELLVERGVVRKIKDGIKILGDGEIKRPVTIKAKIFSACSGRPRLPLQAAKQKQSKMHDRQSQYFFAFKLLTFKF